MKFISIKRKTVAYKGESGFVRKEDLFNPDILRCDLTPQATRTEVFMITCGIHRVLLFRYYRVRIRGYFDQVRVSEEAKGKESAYIV